MKKMLIISSCIITTAIFFGGCYYDKAELVYPQNAVCDTVNMSYSADVVPILNANCYTCHGGAASASGGRKFDSHPLLLSFVNSGKLKLAVNHLPGAVPMPYNQPKLPDCTVKKITAWINQGAKNN